MESDSNLTNNKTIANDIPSLGLIVVIVRNRLTSKYLLIQETNNRGYNIPCGKVDYPENLFQAAHREVFEEAGLKIDIIGLLGLNIADPQFVPSSVRIKAIFYAEPKDYSSNLKVISDKHSERAFWASYDEIIEIVQQKPGFRFKDVLDWLDCVEKGGMIYPTQILCEENSEIVEFTKENISELNSKLNTKQNGNSDQSSEEDFIIMNDLKTNVNFDESGNTLLMNLIVQGKLELAKDLLITTQDKSILWARNRKGETLLQVCERHCKDINFNRLVEKKIHKIESLDDR